MSNDVVIKSGKVLLVGGREWNIRDAGAQVHFVDLFTESRHNAGVVMVSLGTAIVDGNNPAEVEVACRLRMSLLTAQSLRDILNSLVEDALKPVDKTTAN